MQIKCQFLHDTGFRDGQSWRGGTILQFLHASNERACAVVLPEGGDRPRLVEISDVRITEFGQ
jgi:hypothetical protein